MSQLKDIPLMEQPYEKCKQQGPSVLSDSELLAVFIRTGTRKENPIQIARNILEYSMKNSIIGLMQMDLQDFLSISGIGEVKAVQLLCLTELSKRIAKQTAVSGLKLRSPDTIASYYMERLRHEKTEQVWISLFNTKCGLIKDCLVSSGTVNSSLIDPREIFIYALRHEAVYVVLVHNHPSGDPTPSNEDIQMTMRVCEAGALIGIEVLDHIIIGDNRYVSLKERGIIS